MQSKKSSFIEAVFNTAIGLITTLIVSPLIYWILGVQISYNQMSGATVLFTIISIARNFIIRRFFNKKA
jgi:uncharacterized membrane protein